MSVAATIVQRHFASSDGELLIGGVRVGEIVAQHGTPLYVYDRGVIRDKLATLRRALPEGFDVYYSIKANPNQALLRLFLSDGCGLEVASGGETFQALEAGCATERVIFAGPGKTAEELEYALSRGIGEIHVESFEEIETIAAIARRLERRANVAVRVNPAAQAQGGAMRMGGLPSPFGFDEEILDTVLDRVLVEREYFGLHRVAIARRRLDHGYRPQAGERHVKRPRNRSRGHRQHVDGFLERLEFVFAANTKAVLFINDQQPDVPE